MFLDRSLLLGQIGTKHSQKIQCVIGVSREICKNDEALYGSRLVGVCTSADCHGSQLCLLCFRWVSG